MSVLERTVRPRCAGHDTMGIRCFRMHALFNYLIRETLEYG